MAQDSGYIYLSAEGKHKLEEELLYLKTVRRPELVKAIAHARSLGDLAENAEYHAAKEAQVFLENRIAVLEHQLARAKVIDSTQVAKDKAYLLARVTVRETLTEELTTFQLVTPEEADLDAHKISIQSPLGRALLGKGVGEKVLVAVPAGKMEYEIVAIAH